MRMRLGEIELGERAADLDRPSGLEALEIVLIDRVIEVRSSTELVTVEISYATPPS